MEKQVVIDWSGVYIQDYKILVLSIPVFLIFAVVLNLVCSYENSIIAGMLFLLLQLIFGMSLTRIYHQLGNKAKSKLTLLDPSKLTRNWKIIRIETHAANISGIFEKFLHSIAEADKKSTDDVNDIAWFLVAVWAMVSTLLALTWEIFFPVCLASIGFLIFVCFITYYEGHKGLVNGYFEDEIDHLEYHIHSRLEGLASLHPSVRSFVSWKTKNGKKVLNDFCISFELNNSSNNSVRYYLGIPSEDNERIIIECGSSLMEAIKREASELISEESVWSFSQIDDNSIEIVNIEDIFDLSKRGAFVRTPEKPVYLIDLVKALLEIV